MSTVCYINVIEYFYKNFARKHHVFFDVLVLILIYATV